MREEQVKNFWKRLFGGFVRGDIVQLGRTGFRMGFGVYYSHYKLEGKYHVFLAWDIDSGGRISVDQLLLSERAWRETELIARAEDLGMLEASIKALRRLRQEKIELYGQYGR